MKALLFLNGTPPRVMPNLTECFSVCADGAYNYVSKFGKPNVVVGDFDSLNVESVSSVVEVVKFPIEKDYTDGHLAIEFLRSRGFDEVEIYGAIGGSRPDHELCNYSLLALAHELNMHSVIITDGFFVRLIDGVYSGTAAKGATVSLVPFSDNLHILYTKGLKYEAVELTVSKSKIVSVSNAAVGGEFSVAVKGLALLFVKREDI